MNACEVPANLAEICESPIERLFVGGLIVCHDLGKAQVRFVTDVPLAVGLKAILDGSAERAGYRGMWLHVFPQAKMGRYRADFLVVAAGNVAPVGADPIIDHRVVVVECDGKEFHRNRRREQERDSFFAHECGFTILHFTGSEICRDAKRCADAVVRHACEQLWQSEKDLDWHTGAWADPEYQSFKPFSQGLIAALDQAEWQWFAPDAVAENGGAP